ncbi:MAG TPA: DUF1343 domain-containing protein [Gemmatimonadaceae bacterium]|nr:DUF1343 domain-containing protein [Gemmatimonadaceae bacterium]
MRVTLVGLVLLVAGARLAAPPRVMPPHVVPGITVLLEDSLGLVQGKRIALLTNQTGIDEHGVSDIDRLFHSSGVHLVALCSPEHGIRGTVDRQNVASGADSATGLPIYSLYGAAAVAPPDSLLARIDALVIDLQDVGTRTWTYVGSMVYALRAAGRMHVTVIVLDRPNPITGHHVEGPVLDTALPDRAYALGPMPLRHGLTMGELALIYNDAAKVRADLHVVPARGWTRKMWFEDTGLPWVRPSPNLPDLTSVLLYPALVPFEGSNVSVGRGTTSAFQVLGAPWLDAQGAVVALNKLSLRGVRFTAGTFTPVGPTDGKYAGRTLPAVRITVVDRDRVDVGRLGAALLWAIARTARDSLELDTLAVDLRLGSGAVRRALVGGADPNRVANGEAKGVSAFERRARRYWLYH